MRPLFFCFCLFVCSCLLGGLTASTSAARPALVVILLPGSLDDWQSADAPHLHYLMQTGAIAVMNTRTAHRAGRQEKETAQAALLTLGAGSRAAGTGASANFLPAQAALPGTALRADALFQRRTGLVPQDGRSVCVDWPRVVQANTDLGYDLHLGSLADTLTAQGYRIAAGGGPNADWVAASSSGVVQHVSKLQPAPGLCLIWDAGVDASAADALIGDASAKTAAIGSHLIIISPCAPDAGVARNDRLTPVLLWGKDVPAGLLLSSSTRRPGLVTNTDFAPAVADYFGIRRGEFYPLPFGFAWSVKTASEGAKAAAQISRSARQQAQGMRLLPYLAVALGLGLLGATAALRRRIAPGAWLLTPLAALLAALFAVSQTSFWVLLPCLLGLTLVFAQRLGSRSTSLALAFCVTLILISDMVTGSCFMQRSLLGYSAIEGARYYGIGNEAMGLLIGAALIVVAHCWAAGKAARFLLTLLMGMIVLLLGTEGAKAGGVLVSLAVFGTFLFTASGRRMTGRLAALLAAVVFGGMAVAALGDAFLVHTQSHIGEAVRRIASGGPAEAVDIIRRKLSVEGRLAYHSAWAVLLWAGVVCTALLWKQSPPRGRDEAGLRLAGAVGVLACLSLNDAGVIAAALFVLLLWCQAATQKGLPTLEGSKAERPSRKT